MRKQKNISDNINKKLSRLRQLLLVVLKAENYHSLLVHGEGGLGKTVTVLKTLKEQLSEKDFVYRNGYSTPLSLYELLYDHRNKKVIVLDDLEGAFSNNASLAILKAAMWESHDNKRIISYNSKSEKANGIPDTFILNAKVVILCNEIPKKSDLGMRAVMSRTMNYRLSMSYQEKLSSCEKFLEETYAEDQLFRGAVMYLLENFTSPATKDFSFRTLQKAIALVKHGGDSSEQLFFHTTEKDELKEAYLEAIESASSVALQVAYFKDICGASRRTFFRVKKKILKEEK